jgi:hypothetical protein
MHELLPAKLIACRLGLRLKPIPLKHDEDWRVPYALCNSFFHVFNIPAVNCGGGLSLRGGDGVTAVTHIMGP